MVPCLYQGKYRVIGFGVGRLRLFSSYFGFGVGGFVFFISIFQTSALKVKHLHFCKDFGDFLFGDSEASASGTLHRLMNSM